MGLDRKAQPDEDFVARRIGSEELAAVERVLLGHREHRGDDHDVRVHRALVMHAVEIQRRRHCAVDEGRLRGGHPAPQRP